MMIEIEIFPFDPHKLFTACINNTICIQAFASCIKVNLLFIPFPIGIANET